MRQSGSSLHGSGSISKRGNSILRKKARNLAFCLYQRNPIFHDFYYKKRHEGKSHNEALIALWNKALRIIYHLLATKTLFDPSYSYAKPRPPEAFVADKLFTISD